PPARGTVTAHRPMSASKSMAAPSGRPGQNRELLRQRGGSPPQERADVGALERRREAESLAEVAAHLAQQGHLLLPLDAFGDGLEMKGAAETHDRARERRRFA